MKAHPSATQKVAKKLEPRVYYRDESIVFYKTNELFGGLSNMSAGYPLELNGVKVRTVEALYQACRFPHLPEVQEKIIAQHSPMTAKMIGKPYRPQTRGDWERIRVRVMRWCLQVKLAQNWDSFGSLLLSTKDKPIVEQSRKDSFWGAKAENEKTLVGTNILGRLLVELRDGLKSDPDALRAVMPPQIEDFLFLNQPLSTIILARFHEVRDEPMSVGQPHLFLKV